MTLSGKTFLAGSSEALDWSGDVFNLTGNTFYFSVISFDVFNRRETGVQFRNKPSVQHASYPSATYPLVPHGEQRSEFDIP
jgi:hypothetical protein